MSAGRSCRVWCDSTLVAGTMRETRPAALPVAASGPGVLGRVRRLGYGHVSGQGKQHRGCAAARREPALGDQ